MRLLLPLLAVLVLTSGCPDSPKAQPSPSPAAAGPVIGPTSATVCPKDAGSEPIVRQAYGRGVEMWVMLFPTHAELRPAETLKIVVRLTGGQEVTVTADGPHRQVLLPEWGPEWHAGSTFTPPGGEFGVGFTFPAGGCWRLRAVNESGIGELVLRIADAPTPRPSGS
jgi:hypothetical protein